MHKTFMTKLTIVQDLETDANNWYESVNTCMFGSDWKSRASAEQKPMVEKIENKTREEAVAILTPYLENLYATNKEDTEQKIKEAQELIAHYKEPLLQRIATLTKHPIEYDEITLFLTTYRRCPYHREKGQIRLYIDAGKEKILGIIAHELLHFQFHKYYSNRPKVASLNPEQFHILKESLTFLLNHEFSDIPLGYDYGYKPHQIFRKQLEDYRLSLKEKDFDILVDYGCDLLLQKNPT